MSHCISIFAVILGWCVFDRPVSMAGAGRSVAESLIQRHHLSAINRAVSDLWELTGALACVTADGAAVRRWRVLPV